MIFRQKKDYIVSRASLRWCESGLYLYLNACCVRILSMIHQWFVIDVLLCSPMVFACTWDASDFFGSRNMLCGFCGGGD